MKKINTLLFSAIIGISSVSGQSTNPSPYCAARYTPGFQMDLSQYISSVSIGTWINNSGTSPCAAPHYIYYSNVNPTTLIRGNSYTINITHDAGSVHGVAAWIDFNNDHDFDDANEELGQGGGTYGTTLRSFNFTVPADANTGTLRMRVRTYQDDFHPSSPVVPCRWMDNTTPTDYANGEAEDYNVIVSAVTGIEKNEGSDELVLFPNPMTNSLGIKNSGNKEISTIKIYSVLGGEVQSAITNNIDVSALNTGVYFVSVVFKDGASMTQKVIKE